MKIRFTHLILQNWKNFREVELLLQQRMFFVGPNASGKSNLLDAFHFLRDLSTPKGGLATALDTRGGMPHLRNLHARSSKSEVVLHVKLLIDAVPWEYELALSGTVKKPFSIGREIVRRAGVVLCQRPDVEDRRDRRRLEQTHLEQLSMNSTFRELAEALASTQFVHVVPQLARAPELRNSLEALRDSPGSNFIEELAGLKETSLKRRLRTLEKLLVVAVPQFDKLRIVREKKSGQPHLEARYSHWRARGSWQNEREFSDGTLRLIGLLWAILEGAPPLVLEEPELSLHEAVVAELPGLLYAAAGRRGRQILVSTHALSMMSAPGLDPSEVVLLQPSPLGTKTVLASEDPAIVLEAKSDLPLRESIGASTRPADVAQLALPLSHGAF